MTYYWFPSVETRNELVSNTQAFEYNNVKNIVDLASFYTNDEGFKILVVCTCFNGTISNAMQNFKNMVLNENNPILISKSYDENIHYKIKLFAFDNTCLPTHRINIHIEYNSDDDVSLIDSSDESD